jgi:hypothetical protein
VLAKFLFCDLLQQPVMPMISIHILHFLILPLIFVVGDNFSIPALAACWTVAFDYLFFAVSSHLPSPSCAEVIVI